MGDVDDDDDDGGDDDDDDVCVCGAEICIKIKCVRQTYLNKPVVSP